MAWDKSKPTAGSYANKLYGTIRDNNAGLEAAIGNEHDFTTGGTLTARHTQGSARCFWQATAPATRIDGTSFTSVDLGSLWIDSDDNKIYILTATSPTWTPISTELFATFLAAARVFGSTLGITGDFTVGSGKFTVDAASGNTLILGALGVTGLATIGGTLGVTGVATLGDTSKLATSAAPSADAQISNKKYVDDQIDATVGVGTISPLAAVSGTVSLTLPNGLIFKWGSGDSTQDPPETFAFPVAFPNGCYQVQLTIREANMMHCLNVTSVSKTSFIIDRNNDIDGTVPFYWFGIGY